MRRGAETTRRKMKRAGILPLTSLIHRGTYRVTLAVTTPNGATSRYFQDITVQNPETVYSGTTLYISDTTGDDTTGDGSESAPWKTWNKAMVELFASDGPRRVLFRRGEVYGVDTSGHFWRSRTGPFAIGAYGSGADPVIRNDGSKHSVLPLVNIHDLSISDISFTGHYNPTDGTGAHPMGLFPFQGVSNLTIYKNSFSNLGLTLYLNGSTDTDGNKSEHQFVVENEIRDWQDYAIFGQLYKGAILGNIIQQNENAVSGSEGKCGTCVPNYADHGPIRFSATRKSIISANNLFTNTGWSSNGLAHQPCIRIGTKGLADHAIISDNVLDGGFTMLAAVFANADVVPEESRILIERNLLTASSNTEAMIQSHLGGVTIRNNLFFKPNNGGHAIGTGTLNRVISFHSAPINIAENQDAPNEVYNNTVISVEETAGTRMKFLDIGDNSPKHYAIKNNLVFGPFVTASDATFLLWNQSATDSTLVSDYNLFFAPVSTSRFASRLGVDHGLASWKGQGFDTHSLNSNPELQNPSTGDGLLLNTSPAIDGGTEVTSVYDSLSGTLRPVGATYDIGARE